MPYRRILYVHFFSQPVEFSGRVLPAPELEMNKDSAIQPYNGKWDIKDQKFFKSKDIHSWVILNYSARLEKSRGGILRYSMLSYVLFFFYC